MQPETAKFLRDILDAADHIADYTSGKTQDDFLTVRELRDAVHWNFMIIGESLNQLHRLDPVSTEKIGEWRRIVGFRNQLIHGYGVINDRITWDIIQTKLPRLRAELRELLGVS